MVQDPHHELVHHGVVGTKVLDFGALGSVEVRDLPPASACKVRALHADCTTARCCAFSTHRGCGHDMLRAVVERIFQVRGEGGGLENPPMPTGDYNILTSGFAKHFSNIWWPHPKKLQEVPAMMNGAGKRKRYAEAVKSLGIVADKPTDACLDTFVKVEAVNFTKKADPVPRAINPRNPRYNARLARWLKPCEHKMYVRAAEADWIRPTKSPVILKCYNPIARAKILKQKWDAFVNPVAILTDAKRFDQHVQREALEWEHSVYMEWFGGSGCHLDELQALLQRQIVNVGYARNRQDGSYIKYKRVGGRMSGDMNTALGNCLLMTALFFGLSKTLNIAVEVADDGDDCVTILEERDVERFLSAIPAHFLSAGFEMDIAGVVRTFEQIEFCQCHPVFNGREYIMVRNPVKALNNDLQGNARWLDDNSRNGVLSLVGLCGGHLSQGIPVMQEFYRQVREQCPTPPKRADARLLESGFGRMASGIAKYRGVSLTSDPLVQPVSAEARVSFYKAFGILPDLQTALEGKNYRPLVGKTTKPSRELRHLAGGGLVRKHGQVDLCLRTALSPAS